MRHLAALALLASASAAVGACAPQAEVTTAPARAEYLGIQTVLLDGDMVSFRVAMKGAGDEADVEAYGRCAAAQYALIRGAGFARHVRTQVAKAGDTWRGDAVYLISAALPRGVQTIDAEVTVRDCGELRIPTV
ncbi:hypothetical protein [Neotabrizicola sp. VNH66]|uniref:hypothetical protein n=1 Tax=Neotabrizicola sp. VNH66 TaxID=3400918 RepID=UPI003BFB73E4